MWPLLCQYRSEVGFLLNLLHHEEDVILALAWKRGVHSMASPLRKPPRGKLPFGKVGIFMTPGWAWSLDTWQL